MATPQVNAPQRRSMRDLIDVRALLGNRGRRLSLRHLLFVASLLIIAYFVFGPLIFLVLGSFSSGTATSAFGTLTFANYVDAYANAETRDLLVNSFVFAAGAAVTALVIGTLLAWITERTDSPLRSHFLAVSLVPLITPGVLFTLSWVLLLGPRVGFIKEVFAAVGLPFPFDVFSLGGMIFVAGLHWSPLAFLMMSAAFRAHDPALEEAALMTGASRWSSLRRVTLPLSIPAMASVLLLLLLRGLETFEVPGIIGLPAGIEVFASRIYLAVSGFPSNFGLAGAYGATLLLLTSIGVMAYTRLTRGSARYATVTGKGYRPSQIRLGKWKILTGFILIGYFLVMVVLPTAVLVWNSLLPFPAAPSMRALSLVTGHNYHVALSLPQATRAIYNSLFLSVVSASLVVLFAALVAWIVIRTRIRGRGMLDGLSSLALVFPGVVVGVALIWVYLTLPIPIYGTIWILLVAYLTRYLPYGIRFCTSSLIQVDKELEEAAESSGASFAATFRRVVIPLLWPGLLAGWIYIVVVSMSELSSAIFLWSPGSEVLAVIMFNFWSNGDTGPVYALGSMLIGALLLLTVVYQRLNKSLGITV